MFPAFVRLVERYTNYEFLSNKSALFFKEYLEKQFEKYLNEKYEGNDFEVNFGACQL